MTKPECLKLKPQHSQHRGIVGVACALLHHALAQPMQLFSITGYIFSTSQQQKKDWAPVFHLIVAVRVDEISDFPNLTMIFAIMWTAEISKKKMDEKVFLNSHRPSKWFLFWHKQLSQTCLALKEVSSFSHWFSEGNCTEPISSPDQKRLKFSWTLSKWLKPQKKLSSIQTSTFLWQLQDQAH